MFETTLTLAGTGKQPMMSSREIAELTGKEHKIVVRDIKALLEQLGFHSTEMYHHENKDFLVKRKVYNGREVIDEILLDQDLSTTLVTGYSAHDRYKVVKRWRELETGKVQPLVTHPSTPKIQINDGIVQLARVVAEATMKACLDATGYSQPAAPANLSHVEGEYVPVSKAAWKTGLCDCSPPCRARLPTSQAATVCSTDLRWPPWTETTSPAAFSSSIPFCRILSAALISRSCSAPHSGHRQMRL